LNARAISGTWTKTAKLSESFVYNTKYERNMKLVVLENVLKRLGQQNQVKLVPVKKK